MLDAGGLGLAHDGHGGFEIGCHRLLAVDVFAGSNGLGEQRWPELRRRRIEEDGVVLVGKAGLKIAAAARNAMRLGEAGDLVLVASNQDRIGQYAVAIRQQHATFRANGSDGTDQVLVGAHAPRHPMHHYAEPSHCHSCLPSFREAS